MIGKLLRENNIGRHFNRCSYLPWMGMDDSGMGENHRWI